MSYWAVDVWGGGDIFLPMLIFLIDPVDKSNIAIPGSEDSLP
jgi:hypothetical protein